MWITKLKAYYLFEAIIKGWLGGDTHFVSLFSICPIENDVGYDNALSEISAVEKEESISATKHFDFHLAGLSGIHKYTNEVVALVGDNTNH